MIDHYEALDVPRTATQEEIKKAWQRKASENHPDREGGDDKVMQAINAAYTCLSDEARRREYDASGLDGHSFDAEAEARGELEGLFDRAIESDHPDLVELVTLQLTAAICNLTDQIVKLKARVFKLAQRRDRVRAKEGPNMVQNLIDRKVRAAEQQMVMVRRGILVAEAAKKLAANYEFVPHAAPQMRTLYVSGPGIPRPSLFPQWGTSE